MFFGFDVCKALTYFRTYENKLVQVDSMLFKSLFLKTFVKVS